MKELETKLAYSTAKNRWAMRTILKIEDAYTNLFGLFEEIHLVKGEVVMLGAGDIDDQIGLYADCKKRNKGVLCADTVKAFDKALRGLNAVRNQIEKDLEEYTKC